MAFYILVKKLLTHSRCWFFKQDNPLLPRWSWS